jgi:selenocysteine-specific translation elongation factor
MSVLRGQRHEARTITSSGSRPSQGVGSNRPWPAVIRPGDTLHTATGHRPRVRGIQNHGRSAEVAYPGARTALDLAGIEASQIAAGDVLLSRPVPGTRSFDARLRLLEGAKPLAHGIRVRLHHGTRATNARIRLLEREKLRPGESAFARLRLEEPLILLSGDRFVLRFDVCAGGDQTFSGENVAIAHNFVQLFSPRRCRHQTDGYREGVWLGDPRKHACTPADCCLYQCG